jgi:hypothetical protein
VLPQTLGVCARCEATAAHALGRSVGIRNGASFRFIRFFVFMLSMGTALIGRASERQAGSLVSHDMTD